MNIVQGSLVKACAGRDKGSVFVALRVHDGFVFIADGRSRKIDKPKRKNPKHISPTAAVINIDGLTNKKLKRLINEFLTRTEESADQKPYGEVF